MWKNKINFCQESFFFVRKMKNLTFHTEKKISAWTFDSPSNTFPSFLTKMLLPWNINNGTTFFSEVYTAGKKLGTFSPVFKFKVSISHMKNKFSLLKCFFFLLELANWKKSGIYEDYLVCFHRSKWGHFLSKWTISSVWS